MDQKTFANGIIGIISEVTRKKYEDLAARLREMESCLVAFSGGVDSTFLLAVAAEILGGRVLAVIARSETYPLGEYEEAMALAARLKIPYQAVETSELTDPAFYANPPDRCYHCKRALFRQLCDLAKKQGIGYVLDGSNADDVSDFRPGLLALKELGIRSPLRDAGLTKTEIRLLSRLKGLPTWNKPAMACLASRFPYGVAITPERLHRVGLAEDYLRKTGFSQVRVRYHGEIARIEVPPEEIGRLVRLFSREKIAEFKGLGFHYITVDVEGYRAGSLNDLLPEKERQKYDVSSPGDR